MMVQIHEQFDDCNCKGCVSRFWHMKWFHGVIFAYACPYILRKHLLHLLLRLGTVEKKLAGSHGQERAYVADMIPRGTSYTSEATITWHRLLTSISLTGCLIQCDNCIDNCAFIIPIVPSLLLQELPRFLSCLG